MHHNLRQHISFSLFNVLRALAGMAHIDGRVCGNEKRYIRQKMNMFSLSPEQREMLERDLDAMPDIEAVCARISDKRDVLRLIHFSSELMRADGHVDDTEEALLKRYRALISEENVHNEPKHFDAPAQPIAQEELFTGNVEVYNDVSVSEKPRIEKRVLKAPAEIPVSEYAVHRQGRDTKESIVNFLIVALILVVLVFLYLKGVS